ncbi:MAG: hemolysin III family protein [Actinomycetota bacterium]|nr:hemolysin III family protein [Acidimicrobiia bacterium]MDQ3469932.1 hemolysin III family protein [Actinomycetota bacterium]
MSTLEDVRRSTVTPARAVALTIDRSALDARLGTATRPSWRGRLHGIALVVALPLLVLLTIEADGARHRAGVIVYAVALSSMLSVSTIYHRWVHTLHARAIWRRADHAMIYAAIAGTCTPLCLALLDTAAAVPLLAITWTLAAIGVAAKLARSPLGDRVGTAMYIGNGWAGLLLLPALWSRGGILPTVLVIGGGVVYTLGAIGFGRQWPRLRPHVFSYHEVWHVCTLAAASAHLAAVWMVTA